MRFILMMTIWLVAGCDSLPSPFFQCGFSLCQRGKEFCSRHEGRAFVSERCVALKGDCAEDPPTCACVERGVDCGHSSSCCQDQGDGEITCNVCNELCMCLDH